MAWWNIRNQKETSAYNKLSSGNKLQRSMNECSTYLYVYNTSAFKRVRRVNRKLFSIFSNTLHVFLFPLTLPKLSRPKEGIVSIFHKPKRMSNKEKNKRVFIMPFCSMSRSCYFKQRICIPNCIWWKPRWLFLKLKTHPRRMPAVLELHHSHLPKLSQDPGLDWTIHLIFL